MLSPWLPNMFPLVQSKIQQDHGKKKLVGTGRIQGWNNVGLRMGPNQKGVAKQKRIEEQARKQNIRTRGALMGGRTEAFKSYFKCNKHQRIFYLDVCSLYPTANALDDYAVGYKKYVDITPEDILNDNFIRC